MNSRLYGELETWTWVAAIIVVVAVFLAAPTDVEAKKEPPLEKFSATAMVMGTVGTGATARVDITIQRWSTDEERDALLQVLAEQGREKFTNALRNQEKVGYVQIRGGLGYDLRYAREHRQGEQRTIIIATDRLIGFGELARQSRTLRYDVSLITLQVDAQGSGEGTIAAGAELSFDSDSNTLTIENFSSEPVRLTKVRSTK